jgi:hypothetical protein
MLSYEELEYGGIVEKMDALAKKFRVRAAKPAKAARTAKPARPAKPAKAAPARKRGK